MIDSHCHLGLCEPDEASLVADAARVGVRRMLSVGIDEAASEEAIAAAEAHEAVFAGGRAPPERDGRASTTRRRRGSRSWRATRGWRRSARPGSTTTATALRARCSATPSASHIEIARRVAKPLVIHVRDGGATTDGEALEETFDILRAEAVGVTVILHCFSAPPERAFEAAEWGWYCSFAGNVTYPKSDALREAAREVPDDLLLVETDAPFLSPQPVRGQAERAGERGRDGRDGGGGARGLLRRAGGDRGGERGASFQW